MKLSDWARKNGVVYGTALKWFHDGKLPVEAIQLETGTILIQDKEEDSPEELIEIVKRLEISLIRIEEKLK